MNEINGSKEQPLHQQQVNLGVQQPGRTPLLAGTKKRTNTTVIRADALPPLSYSAFLHDDLKPTPKLAKKLGIIDAESEWGDGVLAATRRICDAEVKPRIVSQLTEYSLKYREGDHPLISLIAKEERRQPNTYQYVWMKREDTNVLREEHANLGANPIFTSSVLTNLKLCKFTTPNFDATVYKTTQMADAYIETTTTAYSTSSAGDLHHYDAIERITDKIPIEVKIERPDLEKNEVGVGAQANRNVRHIVGRAGFGNETETVAQITMYRNLYEIEKKQQINSVSALAGKLSKLFIDQIVTFQGAYDIGGQAQTIWLSKMGRLAANAGVAHLMACWKDQQNDKDWDTILNKINKPKVMTNERKLEKSLSSIEEALSKQRRSRMIMASLHGTSSAVVLLESIYSITDSKYVGSDIEDVLSTMCKTTSQVGKLARGLEGLIQTIGILTPIGEGNDSRLTRLSKIYAAYKSTKAAAQHLKQLEGVGNLLVTLTETYKMIEQSDLETTTIDELHTTARTITTNLAAMQRTMDPMIAYINKHIGCK
ncbi:hypothetical protein [Marinomonas balearica]|uniref:Uncharacterized protein n=1 Tax=Marinomonas balearica TaxID=491947 RepID=A0A4R6M6G6_9GAMM|nr:hypothetical protein [Marinomonas balearica]TDO96686.1 hypothetical protein DFP79_2448 [Marinomonas balearica]